MYCDSGDTLTEKPVRLTLFTLWRKLSCHEEKFARLVISRPVGLVVFVLRMEKLKTGRLKPVLLGDP